MRVSGLEVGEGHVEGWGGGVVAEEFVDGGEKRFGVVGARLDDGGVVRGASGVEGIFILFLVEFEGVKVNSESFFWQDAPVDGHVL